MCTCESIRPGTAVVPAASITTSQASTSRAAAVPTPTMRSPSVRIGSPFRRGAARAPETMVPMLTIATRIGPPPGDRPDRANQLSLENAITLRMRRAAQIALDAYWHFQADDGWAIASHIALSALMAMFPFFIVLTSLAGLIFDSTDLADVVAKLMLATRPP